MKGSINSGYGNVNISMDVLASIAGSAAIECFGIVAMAMVNLKDGFAMMLGTESLQKGIEVDVDGDGRVALKMHIIVAYGVNIYAVSNNLIENVRYMIESQTGLECRSIEVYVEGVRRID